MATVQILVANPTAADVTVNAKVAKKGTVTQLGLDDRGGAVPRSEVRPRVRVCAV